jgi:hypothetical protein
VVVLCRSAERAAVRRRLVDRFYACRAGFDERIHLMDVRPAPGALHLEKK